MNLVDSNCAIYVHKSFGKGNREGLSQVSCVLCAGSSHSLEEAEAACRETGECDRQHTLRVHTLAPAAATSKLQRRGQIRGGGLSGPPQSVCSLTFKF